MVSRVKTHRFSTAPHPRMKFGTAIFKKILSALTAGGLRPPADGNPGRILSYSSRNRFISSSRHMPGTNQMRSYTAVVFVSMLVLVSGQCTKTYSGFKQCTILNGATHRTCPASGGCGMCASEMVQQKYHCDIGY